MQTWEYKVIGQTVMSESELNVLGKDGWELVIYDFRTDMFIFKRPVA